MEKFLYGLVNGRQDLLDDLWAQVAGPNADWLALIPFVLLAGLLYLTGRQMHLIQKSAG